ncbi:zinc finger protein 32-like [Mastacembelus armatus]|uniref:zinc finger protein 32-like n=1 Tax=Mastacembelus armatus TaxID=205130 RepID=UPI000E4605FA|nr:zinc finger protein 32-like [Mastacembelus armatus]
MSADQIRPGAAAGPGPDPPGRPLSEMETLRMFVNERLTAAVDDILRLVGKTMARYREQIDRQQRQLDSLGPGEAKWTRAADSLQTTSCIKNCPGDQTLCVQLDQAGGVDEMVVGDSAARVKIEGGGEDCGASGCDPAGGVECSKTEDTGEYWEEAAGLWKPEETGQTEGQSSGKEVRISTDLSQEHALVPQLPPVFSCKVCGESFQRRKYLLTHTLTHVRDCGVCGKHLECGEILKLHLRVHRETLFRCSVCGQSFTLQGNLRMHMRIHSGERPYGCTVCGKSFGRRATLVRHVRSHTGEKPFTCMYCGHGFVEKGNLTVHLRTHTGEKPYWCSVCDRRFSQLSCFYKHPCQRRGLSSALVNPP